jgi:hypothetical protein
MNTVICIVSVTRDYTEVECMDLSILVKRCKPIHLSYGDPMADMLIISKNIRDDQLLIY